MSVAETKQQEVAAQVQAMNLEEIKARVLKQLASKEKQRIAQKAKEKTEEQKQKAREAQRVAALKAKLEREALIASIGQEAFAQLAAQAKASVSGNGGNGHAAEPTE